MCWPLTRTNNQEMKVVKVNGGSLHIYALLLVSVVLVGCSPESSTPTKAETTEAATQAEPLTNLTTKGEWGAYAANNGSTKYTNLDQIDASNIASLEVAWRRPALDAYYSTMNPSQRYKETWLSAAIVKNGIGYIPNGVGLVEAFDPGTGRTIWVQ